MEILTPRAVKQVLDRYGIHPKKRWGQNFLVDRQVQQRMLEAAGLEPNDAVLEIGAGLGALTFPLARHVRHLITVEIDSRLTAILQAQMESLGNVRLVHANILDLPIEELLGEELQVKVVANLPYAITSPLLEYLLAAKERFPLMVLMLQKEVADRLSAKPGTEAYGALTLFVQYHAQVECLGRVSKRAFYPQPEVDSAIVRLTPLPARVEPSLEKSLFRLIRAAFRQRRKTLRNALVSLFGSSQHAADALQRAGIEPDRRGETLSLEEFMQLAQGVFPLQAQP